MSTASHQATSGVLAGTLPVALFGAALDTANLGVAALGTAVIEGMARHHPECRVTVFDNGWGHRHAELQAGTSRLGYDAQGARLSRRYYRHESLQNMYLSAHLGGLNNPAVRILRDAAAVLDVSGGDSFTDMYGAKRFRAMVYPKRLALRLRRPLILLPQTYGPFYGETEQRLAARVTRAATVAWARDEQSFEKLGELLGDTFDERRHHLGVDMAFGLTPTEPPTAPADLVDWLSTGEPVVGLNISGLLSLGAPRKMTFDDIALDYRAVASALLRRLLKRSEARVLLVPHVLSRGPAAESDEAAISSLIEEVGVGPDRARVIPTATLTANEAKWWIAHCDWFCGTRMHATIAALSSGVPSAAIAYSLKTRPVFATVGQEDRVVDARTATTESAIEDLWSSWLDRDPAADNLAERLPQVKQRAAEQMSDIRRACVAPVGPT